MKIKSIIFLGALLSVAVNMTAQTQVIAHRGFWKTEGSAMNSLTSLIKADSIGCYGSEFDVWLTKDDQLIVNHDPTFKRKSMEKTSLAKLQKLKLKNGEKMPSLKEYFTTAKKLKTRLILELKEHSTPERETQAVKKIIHMTKQMGLTARMEYISFSLHAVKEFIRLAPAGTPVLYLRGELSPKELKEIGATGADYHISVFKKKPKWISECHQLGLKVNVWTVNREKNFKWLIKQKVDFITTNKPVALQTLLKKDE